MGPPCDWQVSKQKIAQRGRYLLETGQWSDCKFIVGQEPQQKILEGHKLFLAMSSPVFEAMFFGSMAEKTDPIPIRDVQPEAFKTLLEYIYTDKVELGSFELACELCYCAKKYMLPYLVEECTQYLWSDLTPGKACRAYEFAKLFEEPILMDKCLQIICSKTDEVLEESSWEDVELGTIVTVFEQEKLQIESEIDLFKAVERWSKAECIRKSLNPNDSKDLRSVVGNALTKIRFLTLTPQQVAEGPGTSLLFSKDEILAILMNVSSSGCNTPMPDNFSSNRQNRSKSKSPATNNTIKNPFPQMSQLNQMWINKGQPAGFKQTNGYYHDISSGLMPWPQPTSNRNDRFSYSMRPPRDDVTFSRAEQNSSSSSSSSCNSLPTVLIEGGIRDGSKLYCLRSLGQQTDCVNTGTLDCSVTFSVDKNICVIGIQVPTQVLHEFSNFQADLSKRGQSDGSYTEILYAHLLDSEGSRLTYTHFTTKATPGTLVEIAFNRPVYIQKNKIYRVGVVFNKPGWYPMGDCVQRMTCDTVFFSFGVGNADDSIRDGLIRSIVFTYH